MILNTSVSVISNLDMLLEDVIYNAGEAIRVMLDLIGAWNTAVVANWDHQPHFTPYPPVRTGIYGIGGYIICNDLIWQWVSLGTTPTSISGLRSARPPNAFSHEGAMWFEWSGPPSGSIPLPGHGSYSPKTEGGTGFDSGRGRWTYDIRNRFIRARNLPDKALQGKIDLLWAYAQAIISP